MNNIPYITVFVTAQGQEEAQSIAHALLDKKLAACVNIIKGVESFFWWEGKVDRAEEYLMIIKTKETVFDQVKDFVKQKHSYSVPEIIAMPIVAGHEDYLAWIEDTVQSCVK